MQSHLKLTTHSESIFSVMTALAVKHQALNLAQGFPDFECHSELLDRARYYFTNSKVQQYAPMPGILNLRKQVANIIKNCYHTEYDAENEITITAGGTQALYTAFSTCINAGDQVIVFDPAYDSYDPAIRLQGGIPVHIPLFPPLFKMDWERVEKNINSATKAIVINNPHNPSGAILSARDLDMLSALVLKYKLIVIADEVYEHMVFDAHKHQSLYSRTELRQQSIIIGSFGKTLHTTGWKIGTLTADAMLSQKLRQVHQFQVFAVNHPLQHAIADFLDQHKPYLDLPAFYQKKRDYFTTEMGLSPWKILPCHGTYFQLLDYSTISDLPDTELAKYLVIHKGIACIPVSVFYAGDVKPNLLRICFAKTEQSLNRGADILKSIQGL
jgi:methionine aminotransferase